MDLNKLTAQQQEYGKGAEQAIQQHFMLIGARQAVERIIEEIQNADKKDGAPADDVSDSARHEGP